MLPIIPKPPITPRQKALALSVAGFVDLLQTMVFPAFGEGFFSPLQDVLDVLTAIVLIAICGFKWQFIFAFFIELVPMVDIFPTWTAVVLLLPTTAGSQSTASRIIAQPPVATAPRGGQPMVDVTAVEIPPVQSPPIRPGA